MEHYQIIIIMNCQIILGDYQKIIIIDCYQIIIMMIIIIIIILD